jgi:hypothetical protein
VRRAVKDAQKGSVVSRASAEDAGSAVTAESAAEAVPAAVQAEAKAEAPKENELLKEPEENTNMAAMLANVPTIDFPKEDEKYDSSRKYMYA